MAVFCRSREGAHHAGIGSGRSVSHHVASLCEKHRQPIWAPRHREWAISQSGIAMTDTRPGQVWRCTGRDGQTRWVMMLIDSFFDTHSSVYQIWRADVLHAGAVKKAPYVSGRFVDDDTLRAGKSANGDVWELVSDA